MSTGRSSFPLAVIEYSTIGGICWWTFRASTPSASSSRSCFVSVRAEIPFNARLSSPNRIDPSKR